MYPPCEVVGQSLSQQPCLLVKGARRLNTIDPHFFFSADKAPSTSSAPTKRLVCSSYKSMALKCDIFDPLAAALNNGLAKRRNRVLTPLATSAAIGFAKCHPSQAPSVSISHRTRDLGGAQAAVIPLLPSWRKEAIVAWAMSGRDRNDGGGVGSTSGRRR